MEWGWAGIATSNCYHRNQVVTKVSAPELNVHAHIYAGTVPQLPPLSEASESYWLLNTTVMVLGPLLQVISG